MKNLGRGYRGTAGALGLLIGPAAIWMVLTAEGGRLRIWHRLEGALFLPEQVWR